MKKQLTTESRMIPSQYTVTAIQWSHSAADFIIAGIAFATNHQRVTIGILKH